MPLGWHDPIRTPCTYRLERVSCGKKACGKCHGIEPAHGPYWYAYWETGGRLTPRMSKRYIGKARADATPEDLRALFERRQAARSDAARRRGTSSGRASSGGTSSGGTSSGGGGGSCSTGQKKCGGVCIAPSPGVGCALQDDQCTTCPNPPANGTSECQGTLCSFKCNPGYTKSGTNSCVSTGGGGAPGGGGGGGGGSGGSTGCAAPCDPSKIQDQLICNFYCAPITGKLGLCAPVLNCCTCPA